jgi:zinc protease
MKRRSFLGWALGPAVLSGAGWAGSLGSAGPGAPSGLLDHTLPNGLRVWVSPDRRAPTAVHMLWVRVGSIDEVDGTSGIAHVLEHMMFKGTTRMGPGEFSRRVAAMGGRENAFTSYDYTAYYQQIPARHVADAMALEAERFAHNAWSDDEFRREIEVVKEERRLRTEDNPQALLSEALHATAFVASPYHRPVIGWMDDLDAMTADDVRGFWRQWYVPANAALVVVGDVDPAKVLADAERHYGPLIARPVPARKPRREPEQRGPRRVVVKAVAEQAAVAMAFKVPRLSAFDDSAEARDAVALTVLAAVLDGYAGARLERTLTQGPDRLADRVGASNGLMGRGPQLFVLEGIPAAGKTSEQLEAALLAQVRRVAEEGVSEAELARVKTQWVAAEVYKRDQLMNQASELGRAWALGLPADASARLIERLRAVSAQQVREVAARYFGEDGQTTAVLVPQRGTPRPRPAVPMGRH